MFKLIILLSVLSYSSAFYLNSNSKNEAYKVFTSNNPLTSIAVLPDGNIAVGAYKQVEIWDQETGNLIKTLNGHTLTVNDLHVLKDGRLASASNDYSVRVWNLEEEKAEIILQHGFWANSVIQLPDGHLAVGTYRLIVVWDISSSPARISRNLLGHTSSVFSLVILPNGNLASSSGDSTIKIWNLESNSLVKTLTGHRYFIHSLAVLNNGYLASGAEDVTIKIWDVEEGTEVRTIRRAHSEWIWKLAVLPNGDLISGSGDEEIKIWDVETGELKRELTDHTGKVYGLAVLDNNRFVSCADDRTIRFWNV